MPLASPRPHAPDTAPIPIRNFDKHRTISSELMERERGALQAKTWPVAGLSCDVAAPRQYFTFEIGAESRIVARGVDGALRAMHNACFHRGTRLVREPMGVLRKIVCPYHAWAYGLDGSLPGVPGAARFSNGLPKDKLALQAVEVAEAPGLVFMRLEPGRPTLAEFLAPVHDLIAPYRIAAMSVTNDQTVLHTCNWKAILDNFAEFYHVPSSPRSIAGRKTMTVTIDEHISLLARVQQGMASSDFTRVWLSDEESRVQHFHDVLDACLGN